MKIALSIIFLFTTFFCLGQFQDTLLLENKNPKNLSSHFYYHVDTTQKLNVENFNQWSTDKFEPCNSEVLRFNLTEYTIWLTLMLKSELETNEDFILEFSDPSLYSITLYRRKNGNWQTFNSGTSVHPGKKLPPGNKNNFKIKLEPGETAPLIFKVRSKSSLTFSASLKHEDHANEDYNNQNILLGAYYGILFLLFGYSLFLFITTEIRPFLIYSLYVISVAGFTSAADGFLAKYFHQLIVFLGGYHDIVFFVLSNLMGLLFMLDFLNVKKWSATLYRFTISYMIVSIIAIILLFLVSKSAMLMSSQVIGLTSLILFLFSGILAIKNRANEAIYYFLAYLAFGIFIIIFTLSMFRIIPFGFYVQYSIHIGYGLSIIILSYGLVRRLYQVNQKLLEKEKEKKQLIEQKNKELELKVKERTAEIARKEINLRSILDHSDNSIWLIDNHYRLIDFNQVFAQLWSQAYGTELKREKNIIDLMPITALRDLWKKRYDEALSGKQNSYIDTYEIEGQERHFEIRGFPITENNKIKGVAYFTKDITLRLKSEKQLKAQNKMLKKVNRELDSFVYSASHDLKAPLASVLGLINLVKKEKDLDQRLEYYAMMEHSIVRLDTFIKDIIDYSRNERTEIDFAEIDFDTMLSDIFQDLQYLNGAEKLIKEIKIDKNASFRSDPVRVRVIIRNLISNAIKYGCKSEENTNKVSVNISVSPSNAKIEITDYGDGIEEHHLPNIFKMFYRAHEQSAGTGLGLYIVKETVDKLKGSIEIDSKRKQGSKFTVILPNNER